MCFQSRSENCKECSLGCYCDMRMAGDHQPCCNKKDRQFWFLLVESRGKHNTCGVGFVNDAVCHAYIVRIEWSSLCSLAKFITFVLSNVGPRAYWDILCESPKFCAHVVHAAMIGVLSVQQHTGSGVALSRPPNSTFYLANKAFIR